MAKTMLSIRKVKIEGEAVLKLFSQEFRLEEMETTPLLLSILFLLCSKFTVIHPFMEGRILYCQAPASGILKAFKISNPSKIRQL